jgi:hypothetical protein
MSDQTLYTITTKSLSGEHTREVCASCRDHARYIAESQGPRWYIRGAAFECATENGHYVPSGHGVCEECDWRKRSEARIIANIEGVPVSRVVLR